MKKFLFPALCLLLGAVCSAQPRFDGRNVKQILKAMTPEEKALLVVGWNKENSNYTPPLPQTGGRTYPFEKYGIPPIVLVDGPVGVRLGTIWPGSDEPHYATAFPDGIATAASWDRETAQKIGRAIGEETLDFGADIILGPGMNIHRNPLCGRNFEYFSEDPVLTGYIAAAYVKGVQGTGAMTSAKHFAANSQETNRLDGDSRLDERTLREIYTRAFEICIREAQPSTVMSSYNMINGVYTQEDYNLLTTILRKDLGFKGLVMTDWTIKRNTPAQLHAGSDLLMGGRLNQTEHILECLANGTLDIRDLDKAAGRVLELIAESATFKGHKPSFKPDLEAHAKLARSTAADGFVLMKNDGVLPFAGISTAAVFGVRSYGLIPGGNGAGYVNYPYVSQIDEALQEAGIKPDPEIAALYKDYIPFAERDIQVNHKVEVLVGKAPLPELDINPALIRKAAKSNEVAVITLGRASGEGRDRILDVDFKLQPEERALIENVCTQFHKDGRKVVVILNICAPIETASWKDLPDAILNIWLPGEEGGHAAADVLTGKVNPSGRLPMTFPIDYFDIAGAADFPYDFRSDRKNESAVHPEQRGIDPKNISWTDYTEGIYVGYRHFCTRGKAVSYPFGFGLSYTDFAFGSPVVKQGRDCIEASITVTNTGSIAGRQAVSVYVTAPAGGLDKPSLELKDFGKTGLLAPGQSQTLSFSIPLRDLASFNTAKGRWETAKGTYTLHFGTAVDGGAIDTVFPLGRDYCYKVSKKEGR